MTKHCEKVYDLEEGYDSGEPCQFFRKKKDSPVWWVVYPDEEGRIAVTFDKKRILNLYLDYPDNFTDEERKLFAAEDPYWAKHFNS